MKPPFLSAREHETLHLAAAVQVDDRAEQLTLLVRAARVDAEGAADADASSALVDVAVE
jgi:hypothetical protein